MEKIIIYVENERGEHVFASTTHSVDSAIEELGRYERHFQAEAQEEEKKSNIVENLTSAQDDMLKEEHAKYYHGTDDEMPDAYEDWLMNLSSDEIEKIISNKN